jgi:octaprenyl-diphosphate synthase
MAFQMADDLLDYTSDSTGLGKVAGADLREGKLTLPVIVALKAASSKDRRYMTDIIQAKSFTKEQFHTFSVLLEQYGGIARTQEHATAFISKAQSALKEFPPSGHKTLLELIAAYALHRKA